MTLLSAPRATALGVAAAIAGGLGLAGSAQAATRASSWAGITVRQSAGRSSADARGAAPSR